MLQKRCDFLALLLFAAVMCRGAEAMQPCWGCQVKVGQQSRGTVREASGVRGSVRKGLHSGSQVLSFTSPGLGIPQESSAWATGCGLNWSTEEQDCSFLNVTENKVYFFFPLAETQVFRGRFCVGLRKQSACRPQAAALLQSIHCTSPQKQRQIILNEWGHKA